MSTFIRKLTNRSRPNSYIDDDYDSNPPRVPSSWKFDQPNSPPAAFEKMYQSPSQPQQMQQTDSQRPVSGMPNSNGADAMTGRSSRDGFVDVQPVNQQQQQPAPTSMPSNMSNTMSPSAQQTPKMDQHAPAPDALTRAFNEAVRPFSDKIEALEQQVQDLQAFVDQLEQQRVDFYAWIDKRGLRPDVPPGIAKQMDATPGAADALVNQLDRKITIVNFDLHRLQDDLNDSISSAHFASSMSKFLPDIQRLASIPSGPRYAYDLIIKLVGNLNSHGGVEANREMADDAEAQEDQRARQDFYERMDDELIEIIRKRGQEGENWDVQKEIRRFERNAAFLKNLGIETYFPRALGVMKQEVSGGY